MNFHLMKSLVQIAKVFGWGDVSILSLAQLSSISTLNNLLVMNGAGPKEKNIG